jgi:hypothetical protein
VFREKFFFLSFFFSNSNKKYPYILFYYNISAVDGKRSAQFEHTLVITPDGVEAMTGKNENSMLQFWEKESQVHKGFWLGTSEAAKKQAETINAAILDSS